MSVMSKGEPDLATLQEDLAALKRDVASVVEHLTASATSGAQGAAAQRAAGARRAYRAVAEEGDRAVRAVGAQVEAQPLAALAIALGIGYLGGRLLAR